MSERPNFEHMIQEELDKQEIKPEGSEPIPEGAIKDTRSDAERAAAFAKKGEEIKAAQREAALEKMKKGREVAPALKALPGEAETPAAAGPEAAKEKKSLWEKENQLLAAKTEMLVAGVQKGEKVPDADKRSLFRDILNQTANENVSFSTIVSKKGFDEAKRLESEGKKVPPMSRELGLDSIAASAMYKFKKEYEKILASSADGAEAYEQAKKLAAGFFEEQVKLEKNREAMYGRPLPTSIEAAQKKDQLTEKKRKAEVHKAFGSFFEEVSKRFQLGKKPGKGKDAGNGRRAA